MAGKRQRKNGTWEFIFKRKGLLPEPVYFTFDTESDGDRYAQKAEKLLSEGVVPLEMQGGKARTLDAFCEMYEAGSVMAPSEADLLPTITRMVEGVRIELFDYTWVECWVDSMKAAGRAPSTISKRVSGLARVMDWAMRRELVQLDKTR